MSEAIVLALECSRRSASCALYMNGNRFYAEMEPQASQSSLLLPLVEEFLKQHHVLPEQVTDLGVHVGPGGSTGLRMGVAMAQAWSLVYSVRIHAVPLEALALKALLEAPKDTVSAALLADAFGGQFFRAQFKKAADQWVQNGQLELCSEAQVLDISSPCYVIEDLGRLKNQMKWPEKWVWHLGVFPNAQQVLQATLGEQYLCPIKAVDVRYLKASSAEISWDKKINLESHHAE